MHSWAAQEYWGDFLVIAKVAAFFFNIEIFTSRQVVCCPEHRCNCSLLEQEFIHLLTFDTGGFFYVFHTS